MDKQFITTDASPTIVLTVHGDLRLKGSDELQVTAKPSSPEDLTMEQQNGTIHVVCRSDLILRVPCKASVQVENAYGDATIKALEGELDIATAYGNLSLRAVGSTTVKTVNGDLSAKDITGDLVVETVQGNATVKDVQGTLTVTKKINGDLKLEDIDGNVKAFTSGNCFLRLDPSPDTNYDLHADGDIFCRLTEDASATINVTKASQVLTSLPDAEASAPAIAPYTLTLGEGDANITLSAEGNVFLESYKPDAWDSIGNIDIEVGKEMEGITESIGQQIEAQIEAQMEMVEQQIEAQMASLTMRLGTFGMSEEGKQRLEDRARLVRDRATARAEERVRSAQVKLEQKMAAAQRRAEHRARSAERAAARRGHPTWNFGAPPVPPVPPEPGEPVSEEERLMILRMLEQKKISLEEAEQLLASLEGK